MDSIVSLCKRRGFIFPGSDIYGGLQGTYDFGPLGVELKRNVKDAWWRACVLERDDMEGLDASILMHPKTWEASGHVANFTDPMCDCMLSKKRYRADHIEEEVGLVKYQLCERVGERENSRLESLGEQYVVLATTKKEAKKFAQKVSEDLLGGKQLGVEEIEGEPITAKRSPDYGGQMTEARMFNLMFTTHAGPVADESSQVYLRPETAQGIFVNFENVRETMRRKLAFGIAQIGKSFRNEITPRNFIFRVREFEQMEIEFFCHPTEVAKKLGVKTDDEWHKYWLHERFNWYKRFGIKSGRLQLRPHESDEMAHYAKGCSDVEYDFPSLGFQELEGIANRTDYDLNAHMSASGKKLQYFDEKLNEHYTPYVIEPSAGVERSSLAFLCDAYDEEELEGGKRTVLRFHPSLAPLKAAILPLARNKPELVELARKIETDLRKKYRVRYDDTGSIGRLYRRQDEIGTPVCFTVDHESLEDGQITARDRDTMHQDRIPVARAMEYLAEKLDVSDDGEGNAL
jgi:glycyl-tRNA synthetase